MNDGVVGGVDLHKITDLRRVDKIGKWLSEPVWNFFDDNFMRSKAFAEETEDASGVIALEPKYYYDGEEKDQDLKIDPR